MASYPIPPWLHGYGDPGELLLQSQRQGAAIQQAKQRLAQQEQQAAMENETRQEIAAQRAREEQQQLEIDRARVSAETGLKSRQLDQAQAKATQTSTAAAHRFSAQQQMSQRIAAGEDPAKVALSIPELGIPGSGIAALARSTVPKPNIHAEPDWRTVPGGTERYLWNDRTGAAHFPKASIPEGLTEAAKERFRIQNLNNQKKEFQKELADPLSGERYVNMTEEEIKALKDRAPRARKAKANALAIHKKIDSVEQQIDEILNGKKAAPKSSSKVQRANDIAKEHPEWTKAQIIKAVNDEMANE